MAFPIGAVLSGASTLAGLIGGSSKNKQARADADANARITQEQLALSRLISDAASRLNAQGNNVTDMYGGGARYNPATGSWEYDLGAVPEAIQDASDAEELSRYTFDQGLRREGLIDSEAARRAASGQASTELDRYNQQQRGIGQVDPSQIAAQLRASRLRATNAGFDDAMKAAGTMSLRTGSAAGDVFASLGRARANNIATTMGNPELDALSFAEGINTGRQGNTLNSYNLFDTKGRDFHDAGYDRSTRANEGMENLFRTKGMELDKFGATTGALGGAVAGMGSAGAGQRASQSAYMQQWDPFLMSKALKAASTMAGSKGL